MTSLAHRVAPARSLEPVGRTASGPAAVVVPEAGFAELRRDWVALTRDGAARSLFQTWEWQDSWWRHMGEGALWPVALQRGETTVGLVPLQRRMQSWHGLPLRTLALVGDGSFDGDDLDGVVLPGQERPAAAALLRLLLARRDWDLLQLHPVPQDSRFLATLQRACRRFRLSTRVESYGCTHTPLPSSWDNYLAALPSRLRSRVRSLLRRLVDAEGCEVRRVRSAAELDAALELLFDLHQQRWQAIGQPGSFGDARRRDFYRDFAFRALQHGWLRLYSLWENGRPLAAQIGYVYDGTFLQIQEGFAPDAADRSPGVALRAAVLRECVADGLRAYDNLLGTPPQKMRWGGVVRTVHRFTIARPRSLGALVLRARNRWRPPATAADGPPADGDND